MVWPPLVSETGISVAVFSYAGKIRVSVKVDTAVISDPMVLMENFTKEVEDLVAMTTDDEASS
jgi:predicted NBD/HSP70 family sugar kinase